MGFGGHEGREEDAVGEDVGGGGDLWGEEGVGCYTGIGRDLEGFFLLGGISSYCC